MQGYVKWFDAEKGYGFVTGADKRDYFVHWTQIDVPGVKSLELGQQVEFEPREDAGGLRATRVKLKRGHAHEGP